MARPRPRRLWLLAPATVVVVLLGVVAVLAVPILTHRDQGVAEQVRTDEEWPSSATAEGEDGRTRTIAVADEAGGAIDTAALAEGQRIVVTGEGFDPSRGIYVALCAVPADAETKPGPCLGGVPETDGAEPVEEGAVQWAPSNWINDDWAWRLFGARGFDDDGAFTAYLEVPAASDEESGLDCAATACAIVTRNDHTASNDRVQDVMLPVGFAEAGA